MEVNIKHLGWTSLMVQWLKLLSSNIGGMGLIPGQGSHMPQGLKHKNKT